jgi:peptidoglycan hydrolase CwlO-like protein
MGNSLYDEYSVEGRISSLRSDVDILQMQMAKKVELDTLKSIIATLRKEIDELKEQILG